MEFREITTREEFLKALPIINQDGGDVVDEAVQSRNFEVAVKNNYRCFAAYMNSAIIAAFGLAKIYSPNYNTPVYEINHIVVDKKLRRQGIGSQVLEFCKKTALADGVGALRLGVYATAQDNISFYQKNGFNHTANIMFLDLEKNNATN